ncbi:MAG: hypothetical protein GWN58_19850, partial [Anaerolineae bacterium]|nr:hypothetical protein [Anaerolineae bacterium]
RCHKAGTSAAGHALLNGEVRGSTITKEEYLAKHHGIRECVAILRDPFKRTESCYHYMSHKDRESYAQRVDIPK